MRNLAAISAVVAAFHLFFAAPLRAQEQEEGVERFEIKKEFYEYTAYNNRDPFRSLIKPLEEEGKKGETPLESYDLSQIRLIATATDRRQAYALMVLPDGKSYTVSEGMPIGIHGGSVYRISLDAVVVREFVRDHKGRLQTQDTVLRLRRKEGG